MRSHGTGVCVGGKPLTTYQDLFIFAYLLSTHLSGYYTSHMLHCSQQPWSVSSLAPDTPHNILSFMIKSDVTFRDMG